MAAGARRSESGVAVVEFALVLPLFMMLVLGIFTGASAYNDKLSLAQATREGARYGATVPAGQAFTPSTQTWAEHVRTVVVDRSAGALSGTGVSVCVALVEGDQATVVTPASRYSTSGARCYADDGADTARRVQVLVQKPGELQALLFKLPLSMTARATARAESNS